MQKNTIHLSGSEVFVKEAGDIVVSTSASTSTSSFTSKGPLRIIQAAEMKKE